MAEERGRLRRIFGKVAAVIAVAATIAFYGLGFHIGHAYYQQWQANKAETTISQVTQREDFTKDLPWAEAGVAVAASYGAGFAAIAAGKKRDRYGYGGYSSGYSSSSSNDGFFWGYMMGSSGHGHSGGGGGSSSNDKGGAAAALVIIGAVAIAAGASVVSYKAVKANFFTGEPPLERDPPKLDDLFAKGASRPPLVDETPKPSLEPTPAPVPTTADDPSPNPATGKKWKPLVI